MRVLANSRIAFVLTCLVNRSFLVNSAFVINLSEESGTLVSHPACPTWCRLILTHSLQGQINYSYPCLFKQLLLLKVLRTVKARKFTSWLDTCNVTYRLLTKCEVKMAGY